MGQAFSDFSTPETVFEKLYQVPETLSVDVFSEQKSETKRQKGRQIEEHKREEETVGGWERERQKRPREEAGERRGGGGGDRRQSSKP